jgi:hypothetical protein
MHNVRLMAASLSHGVACNVRPHPGDGNTIQHHFKGQFTQRSSKQTRYLHQLNLVRHRLWGRFRG